MPGLSSTKKAQVVPMNPDSNDAQSQNNVANPEVQPIGFFEALLVLARGDYMLLSEKQKKETMQDNLTNNYVNVGVMSALLLGMVDITSDGVGDKIVEAGGMSQDACDYVMVCLNTLAFLLFFLATLQSLINYIIASECTSFEETEQWVEGMGNRLNSHFKLFYGGLVFYLAGRVWILFSIASLAVAIAMLVVCVLIYLGVVYEQTRSVRALYQAKHNVGQGNKGQQGATRATRDEGDESGTNSVTLRP
jgi:hypothetical protein